MKQFKKSSVETIYYLLILFIAYTTMNKLMGFQSFKINLLKTGLFSNIVIPYFAVSVILFELVVLALLIFYKKTGILALLIMLFLFTLYISFLNFLGRYEVCGCGGILNGLKFQYHLIINLILLGLTFLLFVYQKRVKNEN